MAEPTRADLRTLADVETEYVRQVLAATGGNVARAARVLGIGVATLWRWIRRRGIPLPEASDQTRPRAENQA